MEGQGEMNQKLKTRLLKLACAAGVSLGLGACAGTLPKPEEAAAVERFPLPKMTACSGQDTPPMDSAWQAGVLMEHFSDEELVVGHVVQDAMAGAQRFTLLGMSGGSADYLLKDDGSLYALSGGYPSPTQCKLMAAGTSLKVPKAWFGDQGLCVGEAPVAGRNLTWWKDEVPGSPPGANWFWFDPDQTPFRLMFAKQTDDYGALGLFTFNYLATFERLKATHIPSLVTLCGAATVPEEPQLDFHQVSGLLSGSVIPAAQHEALIAQWVPGLQQTSAALPPPWPETFETTLFATSVNHCYAPYPNRVFYDAKVPALSSVLYWNYEAASPDTANCRSQVPEPVPVQEALLLAEPPVAKVPGFIFDRDAHGKVSECGQTLPGPLVRDWMHQDQCASLGQLAPNSSLNPTDELLKIVYCRISGGDATEAMVFWTWYSITGAPLVFMQSNSDIKGTGLMLADYYDWGPLRTPPPGTFDLPDACGFDAATPPPFPTGCNNCHQPVHKTPVW